MDGLCHCGCGRSTSIARRSRRVGARTPIEVVCGQPVPFLSGHRTIKPATINSHGYVMIYSPNHPHANAYGRVGEHRLVAERALGRVLSVQHPVHHADAIKSNNANDNLVICESASYHSLLHRRLRALRACGNPNWLPCDVCGRYDDPANMVPRHGRNASRHRACHNRARNIARRVIRTRIAAVAATEVAA